jgi:hypothetical protein
MARWPFAAAAAALASPALAGPPFLTDDPEPTDPGHWEIYAPAFDLSGKGGDAEGALAAEFNYGAAPDLQLTVALPVAVQREGARWRMGAGELEASAKYRFYHDDARGVQAAFFPGVTLPTARRGFGAGRVTALLPLWVQKDWGQWSAFGGGGYAINPGRGNRDYWTGGVALARAFGEGDLVGAEIDREGPSEVGGRAATSLGIGAIKRLDRRFRLLASGGPTITDGGGKAGFHLFAALGIDL